MAVTQGHGNPNWRRDEVILALDLYFDCENSVPSGGDNRVIELSKLLRSFPHHSQAVRRKSFRNPAGVAFKLQNIRQVATGKGLGNTSKVDREVWKEFGNDRQKTKELANLIRSGIQLLEEIKDDSVEIAYFFEGRVVTETHLRRERHPQIRKQLLAERSRQGRLACEICGCASTTASSEIALAMFEAHHILPLSATQERDTKLSDMALLCANCHNMVHKAISIQKKWLSIEECRFFIFDKR